MDTPVNSPKYHWVAFFSFVRFCGHLRNLMVGLQGPSNAQTNQENFHLKAKMRPGEIHMNANQSTPKSRVIFIILFKWNPVIRACHISAPSFTDFTSSHSPSAAPTSFSSSVELMTRTGSRISSSKNLRKLSALRWPRYSFLAGWPFLISFRVGYLLMWNRSESFSGEQTTRIRRWMVGW